MKKMKKRMAMAMALCAMLAGTLANISVASAAENDNSSLKVIDLKEGEYRDYRVDFFDYDEADVFNGFFEKYSSQKGLTASELDANGNIAFLKEGMNAELFNKEGKFYKASADFPFLKDSNGYYYYDSNERHAQLNKETARVDLYNRTAIALTNNGTVEKTPGFFPFDTINEKGYGISTTPWKMPTSAERTSYDTVYNDYYFGAVFTCDFSLTTDKKTKSGEDMIFDFSGDDDVWVFIDGKLAMDLGGLHSRLTGNINFANGVVTEDKSSYTSDFIKSLTTDEVHTMKVFYVEHMYCESNLRIKLNFSYVPPEEPAKPVEQTKEPAVVEEDAKPATEPQVEVKEESVPLVSAATKAPTLTAQSDDIEPATGDSTPIIILSILGVLSIASMAVVIIRKRKLV